MLSSRRKAKHAVHSLAVLLILALFGDVTGHIRLSHPPARYPALDFLDSARTQAPCGVPKPPLGKGWLRGVHMGFYTSDITPAFLIDTECLSRTLTTYCDN